MFSRARIKRHAKTLGITYESLKTKLDPLSQQFRNCYLARDWGRCVEVIKAQNKVLQLYPVVDYVQDDSGEEIALLEILEKVSPSVFELVLERYLSHYVEELVSR